MTATSIHQATEEAMACPVCNARQAWSDECRRCKCDLSTLRAAWRAGRTLHFDAENCVFVGDEDANQYLTRPSYREPWVLPAISDL